MEGGASTSVRVELRGISVYTHHGVSEAEQTVGQRLVVDVSLEVSECSATETDELDGTVDYSAVCDLVVETATERSYRTLERLCQVICERIVDRFGTDAVCVRAAKPEPPIATAVEEVAVEVSREREP